LFAFASAPEFSKHVEYESPTTLDEAQAFLENVLLAEDPDQFTWAITLRGQPEAVGSMQLTRDAPDTVTVHYDISHRLYGQGYTTEALRATLAWCLEQLPEVTRFLGDTIASNIGSQRVMEKCGFVRYRSESVQWDKFPEPVELLFYHAERAAIARVVGSGT
jgi:RimJ/RimL family protein N-acetyltransferase